MKNISLSKITFFLLILILVIVSFVWDNSYKIENIFLVLLAINLVVMIFEHKKRDSRWYLESLFYYPTQ